MGACLASRDTNICLVPEFSFELKGHNGLLNYLNRRFTELNKNYSLIVVA